MVNKRNNQIFYSTIPSTTTQISNNNNNSPDNENINIPTTIPTTTSATTSIPTTPAHSVNIKFDNIVNMRDICTASTTVSVRPAKIFRTGCVSKASEADVSGCGGVCVFFWWWGGGCVCVR